MSVQSVVNVASVRHRSPFRYPGGKTWLVPHVRKWLSRIGRAKAFAEPFAGGGIVGLSVLFDELVDKLVLVELDSDVAAVWRTILNGRGRELADRIATFEVTPDSVRYAMQPRSQKIIDRAFATIIKNRMQRGGILAPGASLMKAGENGKGLMSRWYPETLQMRILDIAAKRSKIRFIEGDGMLFLQEHAEADMLFFIDPPYTVAGRRLYTHSTIDHEQLFEQTAALSGDFLMTYDNAEQVRALARRYGFDMEEVAMKNTHHAVMSELLIGRDLSWARD